MTKQIKCKFLAKYLSIRILVTASKYSFNMTCKLSANKVLLIFLGINGCYGNKNIKWLKVLNCTQLKLFSFCAYVSLIMALTKISNNYIIQRKNEIG